MQAYPTQPASSAPSEQWMSAAGSATDEASAPSTAASAPPPTSQSERSVMHPEWHDPEWRYYHGAWGG